MHRILLYARDTKSSLVCQSPAPLLVSRAYQHVKTNARGSEHALGTSGQLFWFVSTRRVDKAGSRDTDVLRCHRRITSPLLSPIFGVSRDPLAGPATLLLVGGGQSAGPTEPGGRHRRSGARLAPISDACVRRAAQRNRGGERAALCCDRLAELDEGVPHLVAAN